MATDSTDPTPKWPDIYRKMAAQIERDIDLYGRMIDECDQAIEIPRTSIDQESEIDQLHSTEERARSILRMISEQARVALFVLIALRDLLAFIDSAFRRSGWEQALAYRNFSTFAYEVLGKLPHLLGQQFRFLLQSLSPDPSLMDRFDAIGKERTRIYKQHTQCLKKIRNGVGAHRDSDGKEQLRLIRTLPQEVLRSIARDLLPLIFRLDEALYTIHKELDRCRSEALLELVRDLLPKRVGT